MKKRDSKLGAFFTIVIVITLINILPAVSSQDQIPNMAGRWNETETFITLSGDCDVSGPTFSHFLDISQTNDKIKATSPPFIFTPAYENPLVSDFGLNGGFISQKNLYATFSYDITVSSHDIINASTAEFTLSDDCNSAFMRYNWDAPRANCHGTGTAVLTRQNPTGCGLKCIEDFTCSAFSGCADGIQTQTCFDLNQCNKTQATRTESQPCIMPAPAPVPEKGSNLWIYMIIILVGLIGAAGAAIFFMNKKKEKKPSAALELASIIEEIDSALFLGDRGKAFDQYKKFTEAYSRYSAQISENDRQRMYWEGMRVYRKLSQ